MATAVSAPNIALIKYWGNRHNDYRLPVSDTLSMMLDGPTVEVSVEEIESDQVLQIQSINPDGSERQLGEENVNRFVRHLDLTKEYLRTLNIDHPFPSSLKITIRSSIPSAVGFASSAAVFSGLAMAYSGLVKDQIELSPTQISIIARLGSGSALRGLYDGFVMQVAGEGEVIDASYAEPIVPFDHWNLTDIVIAPELTEKKVGSSDGHKLAQSSPHWEDRVRALPQRFKEARDAIIEKDFEKLRNVSEEECMDMHQVMQTSTPSLQYLNSETYRIIDEIKELRKAEHLPVLYTMDAGPTVHCFCEEEAVSAIEQYATQQEGLQVYKAGIGRAAHLISPSHGSTQPSRNAELASAHT